MPVLVRKRGVALVHRIHERAADGLAGHAAHDGSADDVAGLVAGRRRLRTRLPTAHERDQQSDCEDVSSAASMIVRTVRSQSTTPTKAGTRDSIPMMVRSAQNYKDYVSATREMNPHIVSCTKTQLTAWRRARIAMPSDTRADLEFPTTCGSCNLAWADFTIINPQLRLISYRCLNRAVVRDSPNLGILSKVERRSTTPVDCNRDSAVLPTRGFVCFQKNADVFCGRSFDKPSFRIDLYTPSQRSSENG